MRNETHEHLPGDAPPPFGGSWTRLYALVLLNLAILITLFDIFTRYFG